jgi:hypothetical protein
MAAIFFLKMAGGLTDLSKDKLDSIRYQYIVIYAHYLKTYNLMYDPIHAA